MCPLLSTAQTAELDSVLSIIKYKSDTIRSIFDYVADEIQYDTEKAQMLRPSYQLNWSSKSIVLETIRRHKGVCEHYAELFNALLRRAGYESYTVSGYVRGPTKINDKLAHAWNAVRTSRGWYLYDPTWSSGTVDGNFQFVKDLNNTWYQVPPQEFILTHIPFDPIWQLLNPPLSNHQIKANDFSRGKSVNYNFQDSITTDISKPEKLALISRLTRIQSVGVTNKLIEQYAKILERNISYSTLSENLKLVNSSLSSVIIQYNIYITAKNKQFRKPQWSDPQLSTTMDLLKTNVRGCAALLETIKTQEPDAIRYLAELKTKISETEKSISHEDEFVNKYLSTKKPFRLSNFYKR
ncbi:hypothetical protein Dfri01_41290 [Dyadobacter frigoris]|nr:hypothetical protein Dfri01_41290 [Dyadobacter frigoris]